MRPAAPACHICGAGTSCWVDGCPLATAEHHPDGPRRYRIGPALVALVAVIALTAVIVTAAALAGVRLAESSEAPKVRPHFVTPAPSAGPCPRRGGPPPC